MLPHPGSILTAALVVALAAIPPASPDDGPLPARRQGAVVSGVVWDSTAGRPLSGATVLVSGSGESAVSDEAGRFVVRGVAPGTQSVAAFHAVFDSLGFAALRTVELSEGGHEGSPTGACCLIANENEEVLRVRQEPPQVVEDATAREHPTGRDDDPRPLQSH